MKLKNWLLMKRYTTRESYTYANVLALFFFAAIAWTVLYLIFN